jgi:hypothetical protein
MIKTDSHPRSSRGQAFRDHALAGTRRQIADNAIGCFYELINLTNVLTARGAASPRRRHEMRKRASCPRIGGQLLGNNC